MRTFAAMLLVLSLAAPCARTAAGEGTAGMQEVVVLRFDNVDNIDSADGDLAVFLSGLRGQGAQRPTLQSLVGPMLQNPYFFGLTVDAWLEGVLAAPSRPGPMAWVWVFPVDNQDEYLTGLLRQGLSDAEGMGDVSELSSIDPDGNTTRSYLEWLPGNVAVFGYDRAAVGEVRGIYEAAGASRGLLGLGRGRDLSPDVAVRLYPARLAAWQDRETGVYWWRRQVTRLAADLIAFWNPEPSRARLIVSLAEDLSAWPLDWRSLDLRFWLDEEGIECRLELAGQAGGASALSELSAIRRMPEGVSQAYALAVDSETFRSVETLAGKLLLGAAGGVVPSGAREAATAFSRTLEQASAKQAAVGWLPPPTAAPAMGSTRLLAAEWERPELLDAAWLVLHAAVTSDGPVAAALSQLGWKVDLEIPDNLSGACEIVISRPGGSAARPLFDAGFVARRRGPWLALAWGARDETDPDAAFSHRARLAEQALAGDPPGIPDVRNAFTMMGAAGSTFMMVFSPVRFAQTLLSEAADWRVLAPDETEPESTRLAREMLEYRDGGGAWGAVGGKRDGRWSVNGRASWASLTALAAALGITETIGLVDDEPDPTPFEEDAVDR